MRIGLDLGEQVDVDKARQADELGLWAVSVAGSPGTEMVRAARVVEATEYIRIIVRIDLEAEHPLTIAEEVSVLDNLSGGRAGVIVEGEPRPETVLRFREALVGRPHDGVVLAPPPVQTEVPIWLAGRSDDCPVVARAPSEVIIRPGLANPGSAVLSGNLERDRSVVDNWRDAGCTHLLVSWPSPIKVLARHLATRAATVDFPSVVADLADKLVPVS